MLTIIAFIFVLGVLVFVHELGHFLAAKRVGIRVTKFQLGFNPTIWSFKYGDTEYGVGALPLGGYVSMAGENPDETRSGSSYEFLSKSKWQRFQVLIMGPVMNLLLAFFVTAGILYNGAQVAVYEDQPPVVGVVKAGSAAEAADIRAGDRITAVNDSPVHTWEELFIAIGARSNREVSLTLLRNGLEETRMVTPTSLETERFDIGTIGVLPDVHPHLTTVTAGSPADLAGLKAGDVVLAVDGEAAPFSSSLRDAIANKPEQQVSISVLRDGQQMDIPVTPALAGTIGRIGVGIADETKTVKPGAVEALAMSLRKNVQYSGLIFETIWGLFTRETSPKQLMGPLAIAQLSGESAQLGWAPLLSLMASISLNLGLLNLLPIPVLDGGHIFIMALEGVARRDFSFRVKEKMLLAGFMVLMLLMVTVIYNDLTRISWIERLMPWR